MRNLTENDLDFLRGFLTEHWGGDFVVTRGKRHEAADLKGFVLEENGKVVGLVTYRIGKESVELITLDAHEPQRGTGTALLEAVEKEAAQLKSKSVWLITTNDNVDALRFYQRRGYSIRAIHQNAVAASRKIKPSIPETGFYGIPIRDEIELFKIIEQSSGSVKIL